MVRKKTEQLSLKKEPAIEEFRLLEPRVKKSFAQKIPSCGAVIFGAEISLKLVILSYAHLGWLVFIIEEASKNY